LIKKIKEAIARLENDTYGICDSCGEDISLKRLKARPVTTQCIDCKSKEEALEKALGL
jgi:DnaK suppressor protein